MHQRCPSSALRQAASSLRPRGSLAPTVPARFRRSWAIPCYQTHFSLPSRGRGLSVNKQQLVPAEFSAGYSCPWGFSLKGPLVLPQAPLCIPAVSPTEVFMLWQWYRVRQVVAQLRTELRVCWGGGGRLKPRFLYIQATAFLPKLVVFPF